MTVPALGDQFEVARRGSLAQLNRAVAEIAKGANAAIMQLEPRPLGFTRTVDGVRGAPEEAVKPNGLIVYQYQRLDAVIEFALEILRALSPVASGRYRGAHTVLINGAPVAWPAVVQSGDAVMISNAEPYARKIELGHMTMNVPGSDHVYQQAQQIVQSRFAAAARVNFAMVDVPAFSYWLRRSQRREKGRRAGAALTYPALQFTAL